ncbi:hypothetical protein QYM36_012323 [Artemia franciscana]|uniref:Uncharacterized protein n=1 Tax=Artemia franciscana TaxID=6661 RepID=A0AA88HSK0_ARTSF|nr:hypothetical protein QYM36_012323 [Artemia franciscana]
MVDIDCGYSEFPDNRLSLTSVLYEWDQLWSTCIKESQSVVDPALTKDALCDELSNSVVNDIYTKIREELNGNLPNYRKSSESGISSCDSSDVKSKQKNFEICLGYFCKSFKLFDFSVDVYSLQRNKNDLTGTANGQVHPNVAHFQQHSKSGKSHFYLDTTENFT